MSFQRKPLRGRAKVNKLVSPALQRSVTDDTQTAINRIVHEALERQASDDASKLASEVRKRVDMCLQAKSDEIAGLLNHAQRLALIESIATLSITDAQEEMSQMQLQARAAAEEHLGMPAIFWRRVLCSECLAFDDVLAVGAACRALRADHSLGLHTFVLPSFFTGVGLESKAPPTCVEDPLSHRGSVGLVRLASKFRYATALIATARGARFHDGDLAAMPWRLLTHLDLSFCHNLSITALTKTLCQCRGISDLSLRGCKQLTSDAFDEIAAGAAFRHLDLCGCDGLDGNRVLNTIAEHIPRIESLRIGYVAPVELWPARTDVPIARMGDAACSDLAAAARCLSLLELDLGLCRRVSGEGVLALLSCPSLSVLMLWNVARLSAAISAKVVERFAADIQTFGLHNSYHRYDSYLHIIPASWCLASSEDVYAYFDTGASKPSAENHRGSCIFVGTNVSREPEQVFRPVIEAVHAKCAITRVVIEASAHDDYVDGPILALVSQGHIEELVLRDSSCSSPEGFDKGALCQMLERSPLLERLLVDQREMLSKRFSETDILKMVHPVAIQLSASNPRLKSFQWLADRDNAESVTMNCDTRCVEMLRNLIAACPDLATLTLPTPTHNTCKAYVQALEGTVLRLQSVSWSSPPSERENGSIAELRLPLENVQVVQLGLPNSLASVTSLQSAADAGSLRSLVIDGSGVAAELFLAVAATASRGLRSFVIKVAPENDACSEALGLALRRCTQLEELDLRKSQVTPADLLETVQANQRSLRRLHLPTLDAATILAAVDRCRHLERLSFVVRKASAHDLGSCMDDVALKLVTLCPYLKQLDLQVDSGESFAEGDDTKKRSIFRQAPGLHTYACYNLDFYRGLQYNDGFAADNDGDAEDDGDD